MSQFNGSYKKASFEGLEALLKSMDAAAHFERANTTPLTTEIKVDGDNWTISRIRPNKTVSNTFTMGAETEFNTLKPGVTAKCATSFDGKALHIKSLNKDYEHVIEKDGNSLKETVTVKGMVATRISN